MSARRHSRFLVAGVVVLLAAALGVAGWRWYDHGAERDGALQLAADKRYADAEPELRALLDRNPDDADVAAALARVLIGRGARVVEVEPPLTRWCELRPDDPEPFHLRLDLWLRLKDYPRGLADADRLARLEPGNIDVALTRTRLLALVGRYPEAEAEADRLLAARPGDPDLTFLRADVLYQAGAWDRAAAALDPLVARTPPYPSAVRLRGILHARTDPPDVARAIHLLRRAVDGPGPATQKNEARYHLAQMLFRAGQGDEARKELQIVQRGQAAERMVLDAHQQPGNLELHVQAARACLAAGLLGEAEDLLNRALTRDPNHAPAHGLLADLYEKRGDRVRADEHRRRGGSSR